MARGTKAMVLKKDGKDYLVEFKWTVSTARDTAGYNIVTAFVDKQKVGRAMGGGYDMEGTALEKWMTEFVTPEHNFYGLTRRENGTFYIDGGCGLTNLLHNLGFEFRYVN